jgi:GNAT superfamily N-acetyltransferase
VADELTVRRVESRRDLTSFIKVPFALHRDHPQWVPPLIFERREFLNRSKNPYFEHAEAEYFIAERDGEPVGRISAQVDRRWEEFQGGSDGQFGFFETEENPETAAALLDTAADWVRAKGKQRILGPMDFTTNDELGILIEGYEIKPLILQPWHPPFYRELIEAQGFAKTMDLLMWWIPLKQGEQFHPAIHEAAQKSLAEHGITIRNMRKRDMENEVRRFMGVYNEAWGSNWGFVPITDEEVRFQAKNLKQVLDEDWGMIAERGDEVVGAALTLPDINLVMDRLNGRLLPFGWLKFLLGRRKISKVRVFALGVKTDYQHTGVAAALYTRHLDVAHKKGIDGGETGWILEVNEPMNRAMEGMGGEVVKKYRLYEKAL